MRFLLIAWSLFKQAKREWGVSETVRQLRAKHGQWVQILGAWDPESERNGRGLTNRWSARVEDKVPSPNTGVRAAQLNR